MARWSPYAGRPNDDALNQPPNKPLQLPKAGLETWSVTPAGLGRWFGASSVMVPLETAMVRPTYWRSAESASADPAIAAEGGTLAP